MRIPRKRFPNCLSALFLVAFVCCSNEPSAPANTEVTLDVQVALTGTSIALVIVEVTASDIPSPLVFNLTTTTGVASGTIKLPAGSARTITVRAYDSAGILTHSGSTVVNVQAGTTPSVSITLSPLTGDISVTVTLGSITVSVTPPSASLVPAATVRLSASIRDVNGATVAGWVTWATRDPGVVTVDATGLVTAVGAGSTPVSANYLGASGSASITVAP